MGTGARSKPARLAEKLQRIRIVLDLSQSEMVKRLGIEGEIAYNKISHYELGTREPPLPVLLKYAEVACVWVDVLIDDELDLPEKLPSVTKHAGVKRQAAAKRIYKRKS